MIQFKKKIDKKIVSLTLKKEAENFQDACEEINKNVTPALLDMEILTAYAKRFNVSLEDLQKAFKTYLRKNAIGAVKKIKQKRNDYTILELEQAVAKMGFTLEELSITYFSEE